MPDNPPRHKRTLHRRFNLLILMTLVAVCNGLTIAQQSGSNAGQQQQQRPRRVGSEPTSAPQTSTPPTQGATPKTSPPTDASGEEIDDGDVVRVDTQLVSVPAVVTDRAGRLLSNLSAENFMVFEDGQPQRIANFATTETPFEVALVLDTSGSTRADVALIRRAANAFIDSLRAGDRVAIVAFNTAREGPSTLATVQVAAPLTSDRAALRRALENIGTSNGTPYYDALARVADEIFRDPPGQSLRGRRAVVALTDGVDSASDEDFADARAKLLSEGVACYFIQVNTEDFVEDRLMQDCADDGALRLSKKQLERYRRIFQPRADAADYESFCALGPFERMQISRDLYNLARREMSDLAHASGGKSFPAADLTDARTAFAEVAQEIGTQYSIGYYPTNKTRDGRFRAIRVEVRGVAGSAQVRAREGYYAPKS